MKTTKNDDDTYSHTFTSDDVEAYIEAAADHIAANTALQARARQTVNALSDDALIALGCAALSDRGLDDRTPHRESFDVLFMNGPLPRACKSIVVQAVKERISSLRWLTALRDYEQD
jgi:hypothetical protein